MNSITGPSLGLFRAASLRSGGIALASACRTIRRCTPSFFATARIVPDPWACSRLISSNSSTLRLLSIVLPVRSRGQGRPIYRLRVGPNVTIEVGPLQSSEITVAKRSAYERWCLLDSHDHAGCLQLRHDREKVPERDSNPVGNAD